MTSSGKNGQTIDDQSLETIMDLGTDSKLNSQQFGDPVHRGNNSSTLSNFVLP